jgi:hypothetical protein
MVTITRYPRQAPGEAVRELEKVVRQELPEILEPFEVQLGAWPAEDGRIQFVCRVETPPAVPPGGDLQWRWWSPIVDGPDELRDALRAAVAARMRSGGRGPHPRAAIPDAV